MTVMKCLLSATVSDLISDPPPPCCAALYSLPAWGLIIGEVSRDGGSHQSTSPYPPDPFFWLCFISLSPLNFMLSFIAVLLEMLALCLPVPTAQAVLCVLSVWQLLLCTLTHGWLLYVLFSPSLLHTQVPCSVRV